MNQFACVTNGVVIYLALPVELRDRALCVWCSRYTSTAGAGSQLAVTVQREECASMKITGLREKTPISLLAD